MRKKALIVILMVSMLVAGHGKPAAAAEKNRVNPHAESGDCGICHIAAADKLGSWFTFASVKKEMKTNLNQLCLDCHSVDPLHAGGFFGVGVGHATGKQTKLNSKKLPLAADGTITCAITCHNMHVSPGDRLLKRGLLRLPVNELCVSCHNM